MVYLALLLAVVADNALRLLMPDRFGMQTAPPDLAMITALFIGFQARRDSQLSYALTLGVIADCFSTHAIGHFAFLFGVAAYIARRMRRYLPPDAALSYVVACFLCGVAMAFVSMALALVTSRGSVGAGFGWALWQALANALCAPAVFGFWDWSRLFRGAVGGTRYEFA